MTRIMRNNQGQRREVKEGFSWTTLFFGAFVPLFRGDWKWFAIMILADLLTYGLANIVFCFIYNKYYINDLLNNGYKFTDLGGENFAQ